MSKASTVTEAVMSRRSIRAFSDRPVPLDILKQVMDTARWTPSGCNFQPWEGTILTGEPLRQLAHRRGLAKSTLTSMSDEKIREQLRYITHRQYEDAVA